MWCCPAKMARGPQQKWLPAKDIQRNVIKAAISKRSQQRTLAKVATSKGSLERTTAKMPMDKGPQQKWPSSKDP